MKRAFALYRSTIGKKVLVAITGMVTFGWLTGHMLGNLQFFLGADVINHYAESLHASALLLWGVRAVLGVSLLVHVLLTVQLIRINRAARPHGYAQKRTIAASLGARTMVLSGPVIAVFILFHLAHLTWGWHVVPAEFVEGDVYGNLSGGFQVPWVAILYVVCVSLVGLHLFHGAWSMFRTVGLAHPRYDKAVRGFATFMAIFIAAGLISLPVSIVAHLAGRSTEGSVERAAAGTGPLKRPLSINVQRP